MSVPRKRPHGTRRPSDTRLRAAPPAAQVLAFELHQIV
jgi:hypothetical protein